MDYAKLVQKLLSHQGHLRVEEYSSVEEGGRRFPLLRATLPGEPRLLITAGFHGEERAGPLTLGEHLPEIAERAKELGIGLTIYPCINPSGFEAGTRYNMSGEKPNNDFLRYELEPGLWRGELYPGEQCLGWELFSEGPKETRALRAELEKSPPPAAALDLHQDNYLDRPATYAYVFGESGDYEPLVRASSRHAKVAQRWAVDERYRTDLLGLVRYHDGSITDYCLRRGVRYTAALETTTCTPLEACHRINLIWIHGFLELAAKTRGVR